MVVALIASRLPSPASPKAHVLTQCLRATHSLPGAQSDQEGLRGGTREVQNTPDPPQHLTTDLPGLESLHRA